MNKLILPFIVFASLTATANAEFRAACGVGHVVADGTDVRFEDNTGNSVSVYNGNYNVVALAHCNGGVITIFKGDDVDWAYYSSDCLNVGGGGNTQRVYDGDHRNEGLVTHPSGRGVLSTWRKEAGLETTYHSPDCFDLGGGGSTVSVQ